MSKAVKLMSRPKPRTGSYSVHSEMKSPKLFVFQNPAIFMVTVLRATDISNHIRCPSDVYLKMKLEIRWDPCGYNMDLMSRNYV